MATFEPLPRLRKSAPRPLLAAWTRSPKRHERIIRIIGFIIFIKIIGLFCVIRIINAISHYLISSGTASRSLKAPGRLGPKYDHIIQGFKKNWRLLAHRLGRGDRGHVRFLQVAQHVSATSLNALPHRWPTSGRIPVIARWQCQTHQVFSQPSVSQLPRRHPMPLLLAARLSAQADAIAGSPRKPDGVGRFRCRRPRGCFC